MQLTLRYGTEESLNNHETLAACDVLPAMLTKGTSSLSRQEIKDRSTALKCDISASGGKGTVTFNVQGRKEHLAETLDLLVDLIRNPAFPAEELDLWKSEQISRIESQKSGPQSKAIVALTKKLNPVEPDSIHYVLDMDEQIERIEMVTVDSVKRIYDEFLSGMHGELTAVGSIDADMILEKMNSTVDGWKTSQPYARIPEVHFEFEAEEIQIETPDKANAVMVLSATMPVRSDDSDWEALFLANDILGGGMASRLATRVRQEKGLSYMVGSQFQAQALDRAASFMTFAITNPVNREELVKTVNEVFDELLNDGISDEELAAAQTSYAKTIEDMLSNDKQLMGVIHQYQHYDRDEAFVRARLERMANLTREEVNSAARKLLNDKKFITVTAGDFANAKTEDAVKDKK